jgi:MFS family permease
MVVVDSAAGLLGLALVAQVVVIPHWFAADAAVPNLVGPESVTRANATISMAGNVSMLVGPALGGVIVALARPADVYVFDALSFGISAVLIAIVPGTFAQTEGPVEDDRGRAGRWRSVLRNDPVLLRLAIGWVILGAAFDLTLVADLPLVHVFGGGPVAYGVMQSAAGVGAVVGAAAARGLPRRAELLAVVFAPVVIGGTNAIVALAPVFWIVVLGISFGSLAAAPLEVGSDGMTQRHAPDDVRGRIFAVMSAGYYLGSAVALVSAGFLLEAFGPRTVYGIGAAVVLTGLPVLFPLLRAAGSETELKEGS